MISLYQLQAWVLQECALDCKARSRPRRGVASQGGTSSDKDVSTSLLHSVLEAEGRI